MAELRSLVLRGLAWKSFSEIVLQITRIAVVVVLARLLTPKDYGIAAMVLVFSALALIFTELALGSALVQRRTLMEADRSTVFWTALAGGAALTLIGIATSGLVADLYGEPRVRVLFIALSLSFVVSSLATVPSALLNRELAFRRLELINIATTFASAITAVALAGLGYGPWALVGQQLAVVGLSTALIWLASPWRPRLTYSLASLRDLGAFGANVFGTRLLFYLHRNADNILVGRYVGASALGAYALAYNLVLLPFGRIVDPVRGVLYPALSRIQEDRARVLMLWVRVTRLLAAILVPALIGLIVVAPDFVDVVLGRRWHGAVPVIRVLGAAGLLQALASLNSVVLQAVNRTGTLFRFSVATAVLSLIGFALGLHWGIVGVAAGFLAANAVIVPIYTWLTARALNGSPFGFIRSLGGVAQAALVMLAVILPARLVLLETGIGAPTRLLLVILLGAAIYIPFCLRRSPEVLMELRGLRRSKLTL